MYDDYSILRLGYSASELRIYGNYTISELKSALINNQRVFSDNEIVFSGYPLENLYENKYTHSYWLN